MDSQSPYESDTTQFLRKLKSDNPGIEEEQRKGRALWWDRPQDPDTTARNEASRVNQSAYVYATQS